MKSPDAAPPRALFESFETIARAGPQRLVIRSAGGGIEMNAAALLDRVEAARRALAFEGIGPGDLVALQGLSGAAFAAAMLAVWARDAAGLASDAQLSAAENDDLRRAFAPAGLIRPGSGRDLHVEAIPRRRGAAPGRDAATPGRDAAARGPHGAAAVVKLTSGSAGRPRGIRATASQLFADARNIAAGMGIGPDDVCIAAIPLSHSYGMANLLLQLVTQGSPMMMVPGPLPELLAAALGAEEPCHFPGVPYLYDLLSRDDAPEVKLRGLKTCLSAAAPLKPATARRFAQRVGLPVRSFYGTSETGGITYDASPDGDAALTEGCVGTPLPNVRVSVETDDARVVVRGENVASGYIGDPADPGDAGEFRDGAFTTGDSGRFDQRGRLHLTGRISALVNVSGRKVDPREIERTLAALPGVSDAAALGVSDGARGEALVAFVATAEGGAPLTRQEVIAHLKGHLAPFKIPRRVIFVRELPRGPRGKLDSGHMRRLAMEATDDE